MSVEQRVYSIDDFKDVANEMLGSVLGRDEYKLEVYKRRKKRMVWGYIWLRIGRVNVVHFDKKNWQYVNLHIDIDENRSISLGSIKSSKFTRLHGHGGDYLCVSYVTFVRPMKLTTKCLCDYYKLVIKSVRVEKDAVLIHFEAYEMVTKA